MYFSSLTESQAENPPLQPCIVLSVNSFFEDKGSYSLKSKDQRDVVPDPFYLKDWRSRQFLLPSPLLKSSADLLFSLFLSFMLLNGVFCCIKYHNLFVSFPVLSHSVFPSSFLPAIFNFFVFVTVIDEIISKCFTATWIPCSIHTIPATLVCSTVPGFPSQSRLCVINSLQPEGSTG